MDLFDLIALALASGAIVDVWFNSALFAEPRSYCEARGDSPAGEESFPGTPTPGATDLGVSEEPYVEETQPFLMRFADRFMPDWAIELMNCPFCCSYHAAIWPAVACFVPALFLGPPWAPMLKMPVYILGAIRLGNLINAWAPSGAHYDRYQET